MDIKIEANSNGFDEYAGLSDDEECFSDVDTVNFGEDSYIGDEDAISRNSLKGVDEDVGTEINPTTIENMVVPADNMVFDTLDAMTSFLTAYSQRCGFSIRLRNRRPPLKSNLPPKYMLWVCHKAGEQESRSQNKMKVRPSQMIGCDAKFNAKEKEGKWMFSKVSLEHNHELIPEDSRYMRAYRNIPKDVEKRIGINDEAGIKPSRTYLAEAVRNHGFQNLSYIERDVRNLLQKKRREKLVGPDSSALYQYFITSMKESEKFFFMMDLDSDGCLRNVMWVDARSRAAYKDFDDAVGIDTTYLKNEYEMPFAPFIGINHHGETLLLGCALLSREDTETFRWLFRTWVDCMGGVAPRAIVSDQSLPITRAIELEMPDTRHRWCLWHIMEKQTKKFKSYKKFRDIKAAMSNCVYDSMSVTEFEEGWKNFIDQYELHKNRWLLTLYKERRRWVPAFLNDCFWAGMSTTQRNEGVNSFFKTYVNSKTSLREFVLKYDLALGAKCEKERLADHQSRNTTYKMVTKFAVESFFQPIYTHTAFERLMDEVRGCLYTTPRIVEDEVDYYKYNVEDTREFGDLKIEKRVDYIVILDKDTNHVHCSCSLFETRGIMCRHSIKVLYDVGVQKIPDKYIVRRWRKDIDRPYTRVKVPYYNPAKCDAVVRYEKMQEEFEKLAITAMHSAESYSFVMDKIANCNEKLEKCYGIFGGSSLSQVNQNEGPDDVIFLINNEDGTHTNVTLQDPKLVKVAGRPRIRVSHPRRYGTKKRSSKRENVDEEATKGSIQNKRKARKFVPLDDETDHVETSDLGVTQDVSTSGYDALEDLLNHTVPGGFTNMLHLIEQRGRSSGFVNQDVGGSDMDKPFPTDRPSSSH